MGLQASYFKRTFKFGFDARTSRGPMKDKTSWFIKVWSDNNPGTVGIGECGPLPGLSIDAVPDFEDYLASVVGKVMTFETQDNGVLHRLDDIVSQRFPSIIFGLETALLDLANGGKHIIYFNDFIKGAPIPINGLIWMGEPDFMRNQIDQKIAQGFRCIKLKIGGLDFGSECDILRYIRDRYQHQGIQIRLDANGAFTPETVKTRLHELSQFGIHSIEQPVPPGLPLMESLCLESPIPVALDEELIGTVTREARVQLLQRIRPQFIVLKPTLHGGLSGCEEWIAVAEQLKIGWWITSALESSVGLNAICQFTANYPIAIPQGLGTGTIYLDNIASPLSVSGGTIFYDLATGWETVTSEQKRTNWSHG